MLRHNFIQNAHNNLSADIGVFREKLHRILHFLFQNFKKPVNSYTRAFRLSHPANSHDDVLWILALSVMAAREPFKKEPDFTFG
jgi:hypothetical protein